MPLVHIKSLPFDRPVDIAAVIRALSGDFARETGIDLQYITVTWAFFTPDYYAAGGETTLHQPDDSHPIIIDLLVPSFNADEDIARMLTTIAESVSQQVACPINNIFINCHRAYSGMVFDNGAVQHW